MGGPSVSISAKAAMERIYVGLITWQYGGTLIGEWKIARAGLDVLSDYKQVVSRLASAAATLCDPESNGAKEIARREVMDCISKLQNIREDL